ncbi:MAG: glycosyltransferase [Algoriphagus sp.]|nr:glycosyltransferase [Algoriphagus sp.]
MKILIPNYTLADSFTENVSFTLIQMGHEVFDMGGISISKAYSKIGRVVKELKNKAFPQLSEQEKFVLKTISNFKIDVLLSLTQSLDEDVLLACKQKGIITISWWGDTAANMKKMGLFSFHWDFVYIKDAFAAKKLRSLQIPAEQLFEAMNPYWHKPSFEQQNNEVVIAGSFYDYRQYLTKKLIDNNIELGLYGPPLPTWSDSRIKRIHKQTYVVKVEKAKVFGQGLAVLNSTAMSEFNSVNCRAFEIAGCGGLHIMENRSSIIDCFEPGKEVLTYDSFDELLAVIERAKKYPYEMKIIRASGAKRAHAEHTYEKRLSYILSKL